MKNQKSWPIALGLIYAGFVAALIGFVIFSSFNTVDLVSDDYYNREIAYQKQIERIKRARSLAQPLTWAYDREKQIIAFQFPDTLVRDRITGRIHFFRPSDARKDRLEPVGVDSNNRQIISTVGFSPGFWRLKISWRYNEREYYDEFAVFIK